MTSSTASRPDTSSSRDPATSATSTESAAAVSRTETKVGRIAITGVSPVVECGTWPARAVVGEAVDFAATVFREGHDLVGATVVLQGPDGTPGPRVRMHRDPSGEPDRWLASATVDTMGSWEFWIEGWGDAFGTWEHGVAAKAGAGQQLGVEFEEGARVLEQALADGGTDGSTGNGLLAAERDRIRDAVQTLRDGSLDQAARLAPVLAPDFIELLHAHPVRTLVTRSRRYGIWVDRQRALYGAWYELFPRSEGADVTVTPPRSGTFRTAMERLPAVAAMGFDVVYLPPIHPIGSTFRKGPNNTLTPGPYDPGVPWAIGSEAGGHDAIHPDLGTFEDFDAFVARARELGLEIALDLALQASPDHPWAKEHPEWFTVRPDGSIAYAENPPKKYQDIYPINFDEAPGTLYAEILRIVKLWISHGVKIFRVDNPHTKPLQFWEWLIAEVKKTDPDVIWLAEAFTRPPMMHMLAKVGFTQSYTYFTWRNGKYEFESYLDDLTNSPTADYMRPNFFVNTPDILPGFIQYGGPAAFKIRAVLGALTSPTWGVYSGYELYEHVAVRAGSEEYLDSEKYQYRPRDWAAAEREGRSLAPYLRGLNLLRRAHPALHWLRNLTFHRTDTDFFMCFSKTLPAGNGAPGDTVLVVLNLDPHAVREDTVHLNMPALGMNWWDRFVVHDEITHAEFEWGEHNYVRLDPFYEPAHIFTIRRSGGSW